MFSSKLQLWATKDTLCAASEHLKSILEGDSEGGETLEGPEALVASDNANAPRFEDSDSETDKICGDIYSARSGDSMIPTLPYDEIVVRRTAYTTYAAVLVWMACGHVDFAPLRSRVGHKRRKAHLKETLESVSTLPAPASPKSVYRLAHLLKLANLKQLALDNSMAQLTHESAVAELFSDLVMTSPELRDSALQYVTKHWSKVKKTAGWHKIEDAAAKNQLPATVLPTAILLASSIA